MLMFVGLIKTIGVTIGFRLKRKKNPQIES